jgi:asparagine synthase (glutamine-hydrolysing)
MCGIVGIIDLSGRPLEASRLQAMVDILSHRGPDFAATLVDGGIGLGHTRLSIIDVSDKANQPLQTPDGRHAIVYNGELYNFRELRQELAAAGRPFQTTSDTEVILQAYLHWGEACLGRLNGMFAFVIVDRRERRLFGARDRFGIKPFHYTVAGGQLVFASEVKAILAGCAQPFAVDNGKLLELLVYRELLRSTLHREIATLAPGHLLRLDLRGDKQPTVERWFHVAELPDAGESRRLAASSRAGRLDELDRVLNAAVSRHLISDVPVGTLCSGGLDSSLLTAMICKTCPSTAVYHVDVQGVSERPWAEKVARHLGIELNCVHLDRANFLADYIDCIYYNDFPLTHPNSVPIFHISALARRNGCKVLLTGEGADELFGGYHWRYRRRYNYLRYARAMTPAIKVLAKVQFLASEVWASRFDPEFSFRSRAWIPDVVHLLADQNYRRRLEADCAQALSFVRDPSRREVQAAMLADLWDYIGGILHRQDRASMQASIESRVPFLDVEVARLATNLPLADKFSRRESKILLKELATRYLPRDVVYREKIGFGTPADDYVQSIPGEIFRGGYLERDFGLPAAEVTAAIAKDADNYGGMLYGLELWGRMYVRGESPGDLKKRWIP